MNSKQVADLVMEITRRLSISQIELLTLALDERPDVLHDELVRWLEVDGKLSDDDMWPELDPKHYPITHIDGMDPVKDKDRVEMISDMFLPGSDIRKELNEIRKKQSDCD